MSLRYRSGFGLKRAGLALIWLAVYFCLLLLGPLPARAEERFWIDAQVNRKPARLWLDTGSENFCLLRPAAERLGLKCRPEAHRGDGQQPYWAMDQCHVSWNGFSTKTKCAIIELPAYLQATGEDGILGWRNVRDKIIVFDAVHQRVEFITKPPSEGEGWKKIALQTRAPILTLEVGGGKGVVLIDTGSSSGVGLAPLAWQQWRAAHPNQPTTLTSGYNPTAGMVVRQQSWADALMIGSLRCTEVIVEEADPLSVRWGSTRYIATLGLAALKRLELIVDGKHGWAYVRPRQTSPPPTAHNRLGATFTPRDLHGDDLVLHVAQGSPASEAGLRDGDVLLQIGRGDATKWRTAPSEAFQGPSLYSPAGTRLELTVRRGDQVIRTNALLRDILPPPRSASSAP
jgi:hypothetical protein